MKALSVTADDWGLSPEVNRGIYELARMGVVRRVSLMATGKYTAHLLDDLLKLPLSFGIHFDLVSGGLQTTPFSFLCRTLMLFGQNKYAFQEEVRRHLQDQIKHLRNLSVPLRHFDSHQHLHIAPGVLRSIADILKEEGIHEVRKPVDDRLWKTSKFPLNVFGHGLSSVLKAYDLTSLPFAYPDAPLFRHEEALQEFFALNAGREILVHPAAAMDFEQLGIQDTMTDERVVQYEALKALASRYPRLFS